MNNHLFQAIKLFDSKRPQGNGVDFANFLLWWIVMEAYLTDISEKSGARKAIDKFESNQKLKNLLVEAWRKMHVQTWAGWVKCLCDKQPFVFKNRKDIIANRLDPNVIEILNVMYCIRGNLIHGNVNPLRNDVNQIHFCCASLLSQWLKYL